MKVGIIVDGDAESQALRNLTRNLSYPGVEVLDPIYAGMQPNSSPARVVTEVRQRLEALIAVRRVNKIVVLMDAESEQVCAVERAGELRLAFHAAGYLQVEPVIKVKKLENWLVGDPHAFRQFRARFRVSGSFIDVVSPNKADNVTDAEVLINSICVGNRYHKRRDAIKITAAQDVSTIASNSRSFRRFLAVVGDPEFRGGSRRPKR